MHVNVKGLLQTIEASEWVTAQTRSFFAGSPRFLDLTHEELFEGGGDGRRGEFSQKVRARLADFLQVTDTFKSRPALTKLGSTRVGPSISNYEEVVEGLSGTPYEHLLDPEPVEP